MHSFFHRGKQRPIRGRGSVRWTVWEVLLLILSVLMMIFPLYAEAYRWINPPIVPAQENATDTPVDDPTGDPEPAQAPPVPTWTPGLPPTPTPIIPTATPLPPTDTLPPPTATTAVPDEPPTPTVDNGQPPSTPTVDNGQPPSTPTVDNGQPPSTPTVDNGQPPSTPTFSRIPTDTPGPINGETPTATSTPVVSGGIQVLKLASVSSARPGQQFSYSISLFTTSTTPLSATMNDTVDNRLEVLGASTTSGSCTTGQTVSCSGITIQDASPATITIQVRVRSDAQPGVVTNQASGSANGETDTSAQIPVQITEGGQVVPTSTPINITNTPAPNVTATPVPPTGTLVPGQPTPVPPSPSPPPPPAEPPPPPPAEPPPPPPPAEPPPPPAGDPGGGRRRDREPTPIAPPAPPEDDAGEPLIAQPPPTPVGPASGVPQPPPPPAPPPAQPPRQPAPPPVAPPPVAPPVVPPPVAPPPAPLSVVQPGEEQPDVPLPIDVPDAAIVEEVPTEAATNTPLPAPTETGIFFRMASDWGSTFAGEEVQYTLVLRNTRPEVEGGANDMRNIRIRTTLPANLEVQGASADRGADPRVAGNEIEHQLSLLKPGETVEVTIRTRIRPDVAGGTLIVAQGQLLHTGATRPLFSNIVTVLVVQMPQTATRTPTPVVASPGTSGATTGTGRTGSPTVIAPTATPAGLVPQQTPPDTDEGDEVASVPPTETPAIAGGVTPETPAPLPATSTGVPLSGFVLLGLTLFIRQIRLHREKERI